MRTIVSICLIVIAVATHASMGGGGLLLDPAKIAVFHPCASACSDVRPPANGNPLCLQHGLQEPGGWTRYVEEVIGDQYQRGFRRFILHLPWGNEYDDNPHVPGDQQYFMPWDAVHDAMENDQAHVVSDWAIAMHWAGTNLPEAEFIVYLGSIEDYDLLHAWGRVDVAGHFNRVTTPLALLLRFENVSIGFDASSKYRADDPNNVGWEMVRMMGKYKARQGRDVWAEAYAVETDQGRVWPNSMAWERFHNRNEDRAQAIIDAGGRVMRVYSHVTVEEDDPWQWITDCIERGHEVAIPLQPRYEWGTMTATDVARTASRILHDAEPHPDP